MRRTVIMALSLMAAPVLLCAQQTLPVDTMRHVQLDNVEIIATRATNTTPVAFTNLDAQEIRQINFGQDLPFLIGMTPSALTTSDAGAGIGYTSIRVRGTDATRINITANGIPINDAESHQVYWVNMPDFASSVKDLQIQRGAGTSTNGSGAFGASINMQTGELHLEPYASFDGSYGSFNTHKATVKVGSGLLGGHWAFDLRLSDIATDGYIDRASAHLKSYYAQGGYYGSTTTLKLITFGGHERTYHAWNYASKDEMEEYGRKYNSCGYMYTDENGQMHFYDDQNDIYTQRHYQLLLNQQLGNDLSLNVGLHYTKGDGYYQEYKTSRTLSEYGLASYELNGETVSKSDLVRKKAMDNWFAGGVFSLTYRTKALTTTLGGGFNRYDGDHFGNVLWVKNYVGDLDPSDRYYDNNATKNDGNIYLKADYAILKNLNAYVDLQYRHIDYKMKGSHDKYNWLGEGGMQYLDVDDNFDFFNPKAGLSWQINPQSRLFGSVSVAHKEPTRNNYTDGKLDEHPSAERLIDYELGYNYANTWLTLGVNLYYMDYKDQLVLTGEVNEIGEALAANVPDSYRAGIELMAGIKLPCGFRWDANATLSRNRIKNFTETLYENEDNTADTWTIDHGTTHISFSPSVILNNCFSYSYKGFDASLQSQYVSRQYMTNTELADGQLDAYFVSNLNLAYTFKVKGVKSITIGCTIYNLFNEEYETNGYAGGGFYYDDNNQRQRYTYSGYSAQAGTNVLGHVSLNF